MVCSRFGQLGYRPLRVYDYGASQSSRCHSIYFATIENHSRGDNPHHIHSFCHDIHGAAFQVGFRLGRPLSPRCSIFHVSRVINAQFITYDLFTAFSFQRLILYAKDIYYGFIIEC